MNVYKWSSLLLFTYSIFNKVYRLQFYFTHNRLHFSFVLMDKFSLIWQSLIWWLFLPIQFGYIALIVFYLFPPLFSHLLNLFFTHVLMHFLRLLPFNLYFIIFRIVIYLLSFFINNLPLSLLNRLQSHTLLYPINYLIIQLIWTTYIFYCLNSLHISIAYNLGKLLMFLSKIYQHYLFMPVLTIY